MNVLVTGGAGYIGAHIVRALRAAGRQVVVLDSLRTGDASSVSPDVPLEVADVRDAAAVGDVIRRHQISACIHLAGLKNPGESMREPGKYFGVNVVGTTNVVTALVEAGVRVLVFSSSCAVYGQPALLPVSEECPPSPISAYGSSKLAAEDVIRGYAVTGALRAVSLRYFNAAGASADGSIGERWDETSNLIPLLCKAVLGHRDAVDIYGNDYPTPDGTALRDYIHVVDLAGAHVRALDYLLDGGKSASVNLGTGRAYSVLDIIAELRDVSGLAVPYRFAPRRPGDPPEVWANADKAASLLGWQPQYDLRDMIKTAWSWHAANARDTAGRQL